VNVPSGNAYDAGKTREIDSTAHTFNVGKITSPVQLNTDLMSDNFSSLAKNKDFQKSNVADVYITSGS
jgi:hypothetical protein